jgi:monoamine oxidase
MAHPKINGTATALNGFTNHEAQKKGLRILIVGAGIGGLTAAIALRRQGHEILVWSCKNRLGK